MTETKEINMDAINKCKKETYSYVRKRASLKAKITIIIKKLKLLEQENRLAYSFFKNNYENIVELLDQIKIIDENIDLLYIGNEIEGQVNYNFDTTLEVSLFSHYNELNNIQTAYE